VYVTVYVQSSDTSVHKAVQEHRLLLKTLSRSSDIKLIETAPADDCVVSITTGSATTLHLSVAVRALFYYFQLLIVV